MSGRYPSADRGPRRRGAGAAVRGGTALLTLIILVVGLPIALYRLGGDPLPGHVPAWHHVTTLLLHRDNGAVFLGAVRDLSWIAWAAFTLAVAVEAQAALRGRRAPRLRLGGLQSSASWLVAVAALAFTSQPAAVLASTPAAAVSTVSAVRSGPPIAGPAGHAPDTPAVKAADPPATEVTSMGFSQLVTVRGGDCLWTIAQRYLGDGDLFPEIARLNLGHPMGDGQVFTDAAVVWPGWILQVPTSPDAPAAAGAPAPSGAGGAGQHGGHDSRDPRFRRPHHSASARRSATQTQSVPAGTPATGTAPAPATSPGSSHAAAGHPKAGPSGQLAEVPPYAIFGAGMLAGGVVVALTRMRGRQRQARRFGRRIPLPASAPVVAAEQRLRAAALAYPEPAAGARSYAGAAAEREPGHAAARSEALMYPAAEPDSLVYPGAEPEPLLYADPDPEALYAPDDPEALYAGPPGLEGAGRGLDGAGPGLDAAESELDGAWPEPGAAAPSAQASARPGPGPGPEAGQPATALRAALSELGAGLVAAGQPIPDITGIRVRRTGLELLLASPSSEPPPAPFGVPGGRQGMAWLLGLPRNAAPARPAEAGDLLPGLLTAGIADDGGYLLIDLEYLRVTTVDGPADLTDLVLASAAAELTTSQLAGWYDLILAGFPELDPVDGRATSCATLAQALDLVASKAVALRRRLGDADRADVRRRRLADPGDEDWALTLLVSRTAPTTAQLAMLLDLAADPGGIAVLVPGGADAPEGHPAPASFRLDPDPARPGGIVGHVAPLHVDVWPQPLTRADYEALVSLFATAADLRDVAAGEPPYDGSSWPPAPGLVGLEEPPADPAGAADLADHAGLVAAEDLTGSDAPAGPDEAAVAPPPDDRPATPGPARATPDAPARLRIGVMGTFTVNGAPAALQPAQSQLILALALNGPDGLSNAQLCYLLGADPDHPKPSDSLRQLIVRTRRQLGRAPDGREWIEHLGAGQYALHPEAKFDWADFEELSEQGLQDRDPGCLRAALALIRGKPFTGCYHWWLDVAFTETVRAQIVDAAGLLAELELTAGDPSAAARAARTGLAGDSSAEQLWRAVMRAEHAAGNLAGVREAWSRCLDSMTDIAADGEPHPDTAALYRQLTGEGGPQPAWARSYR